MNRMKAGHVCPNGFDKKPCTVLGIVDHAIKTTAFAAVRAAAAMSPAGHGLGSAPQFIALRIMGASVNHQLATLP